MKGKLFKPKLVYQDDRTTPPQLNFLPDWWSRNSNHKLSFCKCSWIRKTCGIYPDNLIAIRSFRWIYDLCHLHRWNYGDTNPPVERSDLSLSMFWSDSYSALTELTRNETPYRGMIEISNIAASSFFRNLSDVWSCVHKKCATEHDEIGEELGGQTVHTVQSSSSMKISAVYVT